MILEVFFFIPILSAVIELFDLSGASKKSRRYQVKNSQLFKGNNSLLIPLLSEKKKKKTLGTKPNEMTKIIKRKVFYYIVLESSFYYKNHLENGFYDKYA